MCKWLSFASSEDSRSKRPLKFWEYQDFFALWKDADPDIPVLQEALISATSEEIISVTSFEEMNARAHSLYEEHRVRIETSLP